jgi:hemoglobin
LAEASLYERLGGVYGIAAVVDHFSDQLVEKRTIPENAFISKWNTDSSPTRLAGLKFLRTLWVCAIAGGPFEYTGQPLRDAHFKFAIKPEEFDAVAQVLADSLDHFQVPQREKDEVLGAFAAFKPDVTAGSAAG